MSNDCRISSCLKGHLRNCKNVQFLKIFYNETFLCANRDTRQKRPPCPINTSKTLSQNKM